MVFPLNPYIATFAISPISITMPPINKKKSPIRRASPDISHYSDELKDVQDLWGDIKNKTEDTIMESLRSYTLTDEAKRTLLLLFRHERKLTQSVFNAFRRLQVLKGGCTLRSARESLTKAKQKKKEFEDYLLEHSQTLKDSPSGPSEDRSASRIGLPHSTSANQRDSDGS